MVDFTRAAITRKTFSRSYTNLKLVNNPGCSWPSRSCQPPCSALHTFQFCRAQAWAVLFLWFPTIESPRARRAVTPGPGLCHRARCAVCRAYRRARAGYAF